MSHKNIEIVRAALVAWGRNGWAAALEHAAADLELDNALEAAGLAE
jgi:hypothetical protein